MYNLVNFPVTYQSVKHMKQIYRLWNSAQMKMNKRLFMVVKRVILNCFCRDLMQGGAFGEQSHRVARNPSTFCQKQQCGIRVEECTRARLPRSIWLATECERIQVHHVWRLLYTKETRAPVANQVLSLPGGKKISRGQLGQRKSWIFCNFVKFEPGQRVIVYL